MDRRFPRSLVRLAITLFIAGVAVSAYLEAGANDWLARHPISVNLISAFVSTPPSSLLTGSLSGSPVPTVSMICIVNLGLK